MFADFEQYVEAWSGRIELSTAVVRDQDTVRAAVLELDAVKAALAGSEPKKIIVVPQRIVNIVV